MRNKFDRSDENTKTRGKRRQNEGLNHGGTRSKVKIGRVQSYPPGLNVVAHCIRKCSNFVK